MAFENEDILNENIEYFQSNGFWINDIKKYF